MVAILKYNAVNIQYLRIIQLSSNWAKLSTQLPRVKL